jgi:hypothetical protein
VTEPAAPPNSCSALTAGDLGLKILLCEAEDGSNGKVSFLPIVGWVTLTEFAEGAPEAASWSWQPVVAYEHELRLGRTVPDYRGTVAKDVIGKVAVDLVKSRFVTARELRRSHSPIWNSNTSGY